MHVFHMLCYCSVSLLPCYRKPSMLISFQNQEKTACSSPSQLVILSALLGASSSMITAFWKRWEPDLPRFIEVHCSTHRGLCSSPPKSCLLFSSLLTLYWELSFRSPKFYSCVATHHWEPIIYCISACIYQYWFPTGISEPENCSSSALNRLIAYCS